ncbi:MAG: hypothetical protein RsTaC01_1036 [Candidatus Paraimprobicoccus trichonymphae]|uniref:Transmembrane protein n=1 Tax=Candidatus Paraimprobicoccus trichonymphae TaxID=3033793 RepID=A0AA48ICN2_9FIRM|nr:MAG: hypothetical protein RsTaC01_1036 [Candidatus Paraimprobicoccus trichonymphae]
MNVFAITNKSKIVFGTVGGTIGAICVWLFLYYGMFDSSSRRAIDNGIPLELQSENYKKKLIGEMEVFTKYVKPIVVYYYNENFSILWNDNKKYVLSKLGISFNVLKCKLISY